MQIVSKLYGLTEYQSVPLTLHAMNLNNARSWMHEQQSS